MHYLIIGNCIAGINAAESIRNVDDKGEITIVCDEKYPAYCRCLISYFLAGSCTEEKLWLKEKDFYKKNKIELLLNNRVTAVEPGARKVVLANGERVRYDRLLIATGSSATPLGIEGEKKTGVFGFRTLDDAKEILKLIPESQKALVFGGGLIGIKTACALKNQGLDVEVIVKSPVVLSQVVEEESAHLIGRWLSENGIKIRTGLAPTKILGDERAAGAILDNGERKDCQIIIVGKGVNSNINLVKKTKIKTRWGILTDSYLKTTADYVYSAGDVAETHDLLTGELVTSARWTSAAEQGRVAGLNMAGERTRYPGSLPANAVEFFGLPIVSLGQVRRKDCETCVRCEPERYRFKKLFFQANRLIGAVLIGNIDNAGVYLALIRRKADVSSVRNLLLEESFDYLKVSHLLEKKEGFRESITVNGQLIKIS